MNLGNAMASGTPATTTGTLYGQQYYYVSNPQDFYNHSDTDGIWPLQDYVNSLTTIKTMNIKEKFILAITPEPQKSFRKAEITNGDNILTDDGAKIFLTWLLEKNADAFKKEVVDDLLKEKDKENN